MKKYSYLRITAILLSLLTALGICPVTTFAETVTEPTELITVEPSTLVTEPDEIIAAEQTDMMEETVTQEVFSPLIPLDDEISGGEPTASTNAAATASTSGATIADGIYAFENVTNTGLWMDTQYDSTQAGYHMQQYAYNSSPATSSSLYALFKVTHAGSGRYIIRSMLNNELSFGVSGSDVLTKTIALDDKNVSTNDMFYIEYDSASGGYTFEPCANPGYLVAARRTTASGSAGAPDSYLLAIPESSSGSYSAIWKPLAYAGANVFGEFYPVYIPDGVYAFVNEYNDGLWLDTEQDKIVPGFHMQQYAYPTDPTEAFERGGLFKIKRDGTSNRYIIRSMLNNRMTFGVSGTEIITEELTAYDDSVSTADMFYINYNASLGTYTIEPCSNEGYVIAANRTTASGASGAPDSFLTLVSESSTTYSSNWFLHRYMGANYVGGSSRYTVPVAGKQGWFKVYAWSTIVGVNEQHMRIHGADYALATGTWNSSDYLFYVTPHYDDTFRIKVDLRQNDSTRSTLTFEITPKLLLEEGDYFFQNSGLGEYLQIDDDDEENNYQTDGAILELWNFDTEDYQRWILEHVRDMYYKIKSKSSNLYVSVDSETDSIIQEVDYDLDRQIWLFEKVQDNQYMIRPKSGEVDDYCMAAGPGIILDDGRNVVELIHSSEEDIDYDNVWQLTSIKYTATVNNYYDKGYYIHFGEAESTSKGKINEYTNEVADRFLQLLGLEISINDTTYFNSAIDQCKGNVTTGNVHDLCTHDGVIHTDRNEVISNFKNAFPIDNDTTTNVLWTAHKIKSVASNGDIDYNRSCSSGDVVLLLEDTVIMREFNAKGVLMHELCHQYGAKDHYHEEDAEGDCKFLERCSQCNENSKYKSSCIMNQSRININNDDVICDACKADIIAYLNTHHLAN